MSGRTRSRAASDGVIWLRGFVPGGQTPVDVEIRGGVVRRMGRAGRESTDFGSASAVLAPLLCDIQVNGAARFDLQSPDLTVAGVRTIDRALRRHGVSRWIPTLITGHPQAMEHGCAVIAEARRDTALKRSIPGIHLEGPHISPEDGPRGAHPREHVRPPDLRLFEKLYRAAQGSVAYVTLSPEWPGVERYIRALVRRGVRVSLGHHHADARQIARAADAGACLCTHLGNGARPQMHRHQNPLWPQLADDRLSASFIADGHHLPAEALKAMIRAKTPGRSILVSDVVYLAGAPPGRYTLFDAEVELRKDGKVCLSGTELLAGSGAMLLRDVLHAAQCGALTLAEAFECASAVPARLLGITLPPALKPGRKANCIVLSGREPNTMPGAVFIEGRLDDGGR